MHTEPDIHQELFLIHTKKANDFLKDQLAKSNDGRHKIFGLKTYCALVRKIWENTKLDDPYADLALCEIERRLQNAIIELSKNYKRLDLGVDLRLSKYLEQLFTHSPSRFGHIYSEDFLLEPIKIKVTSNIPHTNLGTALLAIYDDIACKASIYKYTKLITNNLYHKYIKNSRKAIRSVFSAPLIYKDSGITRQDIINKTSEGLSALEHYGPIPELILTHKFSHFGHS